MPAEQSWPNKLIFLVALRGHARWCPLPQITLVAMKPLDIAWTIPGASWKQPKSDTHLRDLSGISH